VSIALNTLLQAPAKSCRHFENMIVADEGNHISRAVQHGSAVAAFLEMCFHATPELSVDFSIKQIRNFAPNVFATDFKSQ